MQAGKVAFGKVYGFRLNADGKPEIISEDAEVIRRIFRWFSGGTSLHEIKRRLETEQILTPTGKNTWSVSTLSSILQNEKYIGDVMLQKTFVSDTLTGKVEKNQGEFPQYYIENHHEAIVSKEIFEKVQEKFTHLAKESTGSEKNAPKFHSSRYALSDCLVCHYCGASYVRKIWSSQNGKKTAVWRCQTRVKEGVKYCEDSVSLKEIQLQEKILTVIQENFPKDEWELVDYLPKVVDKNLTTISTEEVNKLKKRLISLMSAVEDYELKLGEIEEKIIGFQKLLNPKVNGKEPIAEKTEISWSEDLIRQFISNIVVKHQNHLTIYFMDGNIVEIKD